MTSLTSPVLRADLHTFFKSALAAFEAHHHHFSLLCTVTDPSPTRPTPPPPTPKPPVERLVILDASFNPPTVAHSRMVRSAVERFYDGGGATAQKGPTPRREDGSGGGEAAAVGSLRVLLLLSVNNADKAPKPASFPQRLGMMYLFAKELVRELPPGLEVDVALSSRPYFHSKCELIARSGVYGDAGAMEQVFLVGYDTLIRIFDAKYYSAERPMEASLGPFFERARLVVALRTGDKWGGEEEQRAYLAGLRDGGLERVGGRGEWIERVELLSAGGDSVESTAVSSTAVRNAVRDGDEAVLGILLGEGVRAWVLGEGLYREEA